MMLIKVKTPGKIDEMDFMEITHRREELEMLLAECPDMPQDHPLRVEFRALCRLLTDPLYE